MSFEFIDLKKRQEIEFHLEDGVIKKSAHAHSALIQNGQFCVRISYGKKILSW